MVIPGDVMSAGRAIGKDQVSLATRQQETLRHQRNTADVGHRQGLTGG